MKKLLKRIGYESIPKWAREEVIERVFLALAIIFIAISLAELVTMAGLKTLGYL